MSQSSSFDFCLEFVSFLSLMDYIEECRPPLSESELKDIAAVEARLQATLDGKRPIVEELIRTSDGERRVRLYFSADLDAFFSQSAPTDNEDRSLHNVLRALYTSWAVLNRRGGVLDSDRGPAPEPYDLSLRLPHWARILNICPILRVTWDSATGCVTNDLVYPEALKEFVSSLP